MNGKVTDAAARLERAYTAGMDEEFRDDLRVVLDALPKPAKPEAVRLRDELRERAEFEAWAEGRYNLDKRVNVVGDLVYADRWVQGAFVGWQAALAATGKQQVGEVQGLDALAEKLVSDWQADGRMQPHAWDYRGFAKDAMRRVITARQPDMQKPYAPEGYSIISDHQLDHLRERADVQLRIEGKEVWHWMGDGSDYPESLACPVVMTADTLRTLLAARPPVGEPIAWRIVHPEGNRSQKWSDGPGLWPATDGALGLRFEYAYAAPPAQAVDLGQAIEQIAQQWDGCSYDAVGETIEIGRAIRAAGKRLADSKGAQS